MNIKIFYEDENMIVALKPAKVPSQPDKTGDMDFLTALKLEKNNENIGLIHRLDRPVGGIMVFSKNKKTETLLSKLMAEKNIKKTYVAVVYGKPPEKGTLRDYIVKNTRLNVSTIVNSNVKGAKEAILYYDRIAVCEDSELGVVSLVKINLETGRHHQIRVQFANAGFPLVGDMKYNKERRTRKRVDVGLFSAGLSFKPYKNKEIFEFFEMPESYPFSIFS